MPENLILIILATFGVPFLILVFDNVRRGGTALDVMRRSGRDLSLVGLGSSGAVFVNPKATAAFPIPSTLVVVLVLATLFTLHQWCANVNERPPSRWNAVSSCGFGMASVAIVLCVLAYGYVRS